MANSLTPHKSYYERLVEADKSNDFRKILIRLMNRVIMKVKVPIEVREEFCMDVLTMYYERFWCSRRSRQPSKHPLNILSTRRH
ncbi:hypothetical protein EFP10_32 [Enterococcus phage EF-P10]|nr:hypothetical protein EFP10_32 [Enterococcus phage EF-P10]